MVLVKNIAFVLLIFFCAAMLSTAWFNPTGAKVSEISDIKAGIATSATKGTTVKIAVVEGNLNKPNVKKLVRKSEKVKSASSVEDNTSVRSRLHDEVDRGLVAFTADYHRPMHHPPKNNK